ncbi:MAG: choice-of-anchor D domain-containing protein [Deltaproteobacteria bacterium]|nr:choice-of-anchor D domain-containing protein [Deltaproteobacteria bacterium]
MNGPGCSDVAIPNGSGSNFQVELTCFPQKPGSFATTLHVVGADGQNVEVPVSCNGSGSGSGAPQIAVNPPSTMQMTAVNSASPVTFSVSNAGGSSLSLTGYSLAPEPAWTVRWDPSCPAGVCTLAPSAATSVTATFAPLSIGPHNSSLSITSNGGNPIIDLLGTGSGAQLELATNLGNPATLDFGDRPVGVESNPPTTFALRNTGNTPLFQISLTTAMPDGAYTISPATLDLAGGEIAMIAVRCTAPSIASFDNTLRVRAPGAIATIPDPLDIQLHCAGTNAQLVASPSPIQLGEIRKGTQRSQTITLATVGAALAVTAPPALVDPDPQLTVSATDTQTITAATPAHFTLDVNATTDGDLANSITVTARDTVTIAVTGQVVTPSITYPTALNLGTFCIGSPTPATSASLTATGTASIAMAVKPQLAKAAASPFTIAYIAPPEAAYAYQLFGNGMMATVALQPQRQTTSGTQTDNLVWTTDMPGQEMVTTSLTTTFVGDGGGISPQTLGFGTVPVRQRSETRQITIENCGDAPLDLTPPTIVPDDAFHDESTTPLPAVLQPHEKALIGVTFVPVRAGVTTAVLSVAASTGTLRVDLDGTGLGNSDDTGERRSFYACTCGSGTPISGLPIVLVVGGVLLRRRRR